jgi:pimeloyl-ACP methyl ester carboxylesterase
MRLDNALLILAATRAAAQVFPLPGGPYDVTWENFEMVDEARQDPFNATHLRRIMVSRFAPVSEGCCQKICNVPYMTEEMAEIQEAIIIPWLAPIVWPSGLLASLEIPFCCDTDGAASAEVFPTIFLGSGLNTTRAYYSGLGQQLASLGYTVLAMDHPYETDVVQFPNGDIIFGGRIEGNVNNTAELVFGLDVRTQDIGFLMDTFELEESIYIGHSYGGAAAAHALLKEPRLVAGVNLDGALWGDVQYTGVSRPFLSLGSVGHNSSTPEEPSWGNFYAAMETYHSDVWARELSLKESAHNSYQDLGVIGDVAGLREDEALVDRLFGKLLGSRAMELLREYLGDFIELTLLDGDEGLLAGPSNDFPEVVFVR